MKPILELKNIDKRFGAVHALKEVSLSIREGEMIALAGENGAGKSTLMKILTGAYAKDSGEVWFEGRKEDYRDTITAKRLGIAQVYQQAELVPDLTVAENIYLGEKLMNGVVKWGQLFARTEALLSEYGIPIDARAKVGTLNVANRQLVAVAKVLQREPKLLILDEPTAVLSDQEVTILFHLIEVLKKKGTTMIYISHRLEELFRLCDRIAVMRDGAMITVLDNVHLTKADLIVHMLGRRVDAMFPEKTLERSDEVVLEAKGVTTDKVSDISFQLHKGEILGVAGLVGSGRTEMVRALYGLDKLKSGVIEVGGKPVKMRSPVDAVRHGMFLAPEDRKGEALVLIRSIRENVTLSNFGRMARGGIIRGQQERDYIETLREELRIKADTIESPVNTLSGGNQQKVVVAKAIAAHPEILIFDEPTQGIDVGAKSEIYALLENLRKAGMSILVISSEIEEVQGICSRLLVMRGGRIVGEVKDHLEDSEHILSLMYRSETA
ncbi:sugar ABC transporter ATP-binding protein [Agathobaculum sp.]|uniref:sugar ABC transporter ATP-binding protein n=1 Tax=Agathobaculum sp. TaxID=2048138 RepID=UPI002A815224|nr:sugar ABC transporter ATP-binding protein [Agathobaculum sp.]MDY3619494.1 sugar ABC transporter ATP-binding protein [Agathobaculum sp.]